MTFVRMGQNCIGKFMPLKIFYAQNKEKILLIIDLSCVLSFPIQIDNDALSAPVLKDRKLKQAYKAIKLGNNPLHLLLN